MSDFLKLNIGNSFFICESLCWRLAQESAARGSEAQRHVVVIYQENVYFDYYFATYPNAKNPKREPKIIARENTPTVEEMKRKQNNNGY